MDMEELLMKMNMVKKHNEIVRLKKQIEQKDNENSRLMEDYKNTFDTFDHKISSINDELCQKVETLKSENIRLKSNVEKLETENIRYKEQIESIPKFILRLF